MPDSQADVLLGRLASVTRELVDYCWTKVPWSNGEFIRRILRAGEVLEEVVGARCDALEERGRALDERLDEIEARIRSVEAARG